MQNAVGMLLLLLILGLTLCVPGLGDARAEADEAGSFDRTWNFEAGYEGWIIHGGQWSAEDGQLRHADPNFHGGLVGLPGYRFGDLEFTADLHIPEVYWDEDSVWAGLAFHASAPVQHGGWHDGYLAFVRCDGEVVLVRNRGHELATFQSELNPREEVVRLGVRTEGARIIVLLNGEEVLSAEDDTFTGGEIALINFGNVATYSNVHVVGTRLAPLAVEAVQPEHPEPIEAEPVTPLPRIAVEKEPGTPGRFYYRDSGETFHPLGFNHTVLEFGDSGWHATFNTNVYEPEQMEATLAEMAELGTNVLRVWIWGTQNEYGFTGDNEHRGLNGGYMENLIDFLQRATRHGIYIMPIVDATPHNAYYSAVNALYQDATHDDKITGRNLQYLTRGGIAAKRMAIQDMIRYIRDVDEGLLNSIFAWALANEVYVSFNRGPFNQLEGEVTTATGKTYDLSDKASRQAAYDETIRYWADELATGIRALDPEALVTTGMWTSDAHNRPPFNGLMPDDSDPRIPPRPSAFLGSDAPLDFLDIHIYPWDRTPTVRPEAHEWEAIMAGTVPAIVGEYGVFKHLDPPEKAREMLREMLTQAAEMGYLGGLYWIWDLVEVEHQTWSAVQEDFGAYVMDLKRDLWVETP